MLILNRQPSTREANERRSVYHRLIGARRGGPKKRKKYIYKEEREDRRARACLVFPILWTLDPLSLGFNFWPPVRATLPVPPRRVFLVARGSSHVIRSRATCRRIHGVHDASATMLPRPRCGTRRGDVQCDSNQQPRPCQRALHFSRVSSQLFSSPFPLPRLFSCSLSFFLFLLVFLLSKVHAILASSSMTQTVTV